jgi:hypothetical protein
MFWQGGPIKAMSATPRAPHNLHLLIFLFLLLPALACKAFTPSTSTPMPSPDTGEGIRITYPTGIETIRLDSGMIVTVDHKGSYCMAFPVQWEVGAFHEDFIPTVDKYAQIHEGIKLLFETIYGKDNSLRIFAIDTSPDHLTENNMTVLHIGMFQEEWRLQSTMDELTTEYMAYVTSSGQLKITDTLLGKTKYEVPFVILLTEPVSTSGGDSPAYSAAVLLKTDYAYLEMLYTTLDKSINIVDELSPILTSFGTCHD